MIFLRSVCPKKVIDNLQYRHIELKGIKIRPNIRIGDAIGVDDLFEDEYNAIFIGTGVWRSDRLQSREKPLVRLQMNTETQSDDINCC